MKKFLSLILVFLLIISLGVGCAQEEPPAEEPNVEQPPAETPDEDGDEEGNNEDGQVGEEDPDEVTTASIVNDEEAFINAISADGTWIIATLNDLTIDQDIVLEGEFHNKDDATQDLYRKIALYAQDEERNVTARYTLTAPKLTIKSPNAKIQGGTFKGDVYVEANGFVVQDGTIEGNVYFATQEYKDSFTLESDGTVTGTTEVQQQ